MKCWLALWVNKIWSPSSLGKAGGGKLRSDPRWRDVTGDTNGFYQVSAIKLIQMPFFLPLDLPFSEDIRNQRGFYWEDRRLASFRTSSLSFGFRIILEASHAYALKEKRNPENIQHQWPSLSALWQTPVGKELNTHLNEIPQLRPRTNPSREKTETILSSQSVDFKRGLLSLILTFMRLEIPILAPSVAIITLLRLSSAKNAHPQNSGV